MMRFGRPQPRLLRLSTIYSRMWALSWKVRNFHPLCYSTLLNVCYNRPQGFYRQVNTSVILLIIPPPWISSAESVPQVISFSKTFRPGSLPQTHGRIKASHPKFTIMEPRHGSSKATLSPNGNPPVPFYGFMESVCLSHLFSR
jgi:hypothetical protein